MVITLIGPDTGGIAHVAQSVAANWPIVAEPLRPLLIAEDGSVSRSECDCPSAIEGRRGPVAWSAVRAAWRHRHCLRASTSLHLELGRVSVAAFWFLLAASALNRRAPLVTATHDIPTVILHPGAATISLAPGWRDVLAFRLLSPLLDAVLLRRLRHRTTATVVLSAAAAATATAGHWPRVTQIDHGAEAKFEPSVAPGEAGYVLLIGYLGPGKGLDVLAAAWEQADNPLPLVIAGGHSTQHADWVEAVRDRFDQSSRPPTWRGFVSDAEFSRLVRESAVVVLPYEESNPASGVLIRALVEGRAVVATAVRAVTEEVDDGVNGLIVPPGDASALAEALRRVTTSPELRDQLGAAAARLAATRHSWLMHCAALATLHQSLAIAGAASAPQLLDAGDPA